MSDAIEIIDGHARAKSRFTREDRRLLVEMIAQELDDRRNDKRRLHLEREWDEIDRQIRMEPERVHKMIDGRIDRSRNWMPEVELPTQAQTLELLVADERRLMAPTSGAWFEAHVALTDEYLARVDLQSLVAGDLNDVPSQITQDNADKLVQGLMLHWQRQYPFWEHVDLINAEAAKYGTGIGRVMAVRMRTQTVRRSGVLVRERLIPVLVPRTIRQVYLDTHETSMMNEGLATSPMHIFVSRMRYEDLVRAARQGGTDPDDVLGGWFPQSVEDLKPGADGTIEIVEAEGDFFVPRKTRDSFVIPNAIITIAKSGSGTTVDKRLLRLRFRPFGRSSYIVFPYHREDLLFPYGRGPLQMGRPVQKAMTDTLVRFMITAQLNAQPPVSYDRDDMQFAQEGGPQLFPGAQWPTTGGIKTYPIGDPSAMFQAYVGFLQQYADVTGVNAPRLGQQTVSHTTAFAKEVEISRSQVRTVDYVNATLAGPMTEFLDRAWEIGREFMQPTNFYIESYQGWVTAEKRHLPDIVTFTAHGAGGPSEQLARQQRRLSALNTVLQIEQIAQAARASGLPTDLDFAAIKRQVLADGGWTDIDVILSGAEAVAGAVAQTGVAGNPQSPVQPATAAALQALAFGG